MDLKLFITACVLGGLGGLAGSILGNAFGQTGLFVGGFVGGVAMAPVSASIARHRQWITPTQFWPTSSGAAIGFVAAALVAINTLSSPVGPALSTALTGLGALVGKRLAR